MRIAAHLACAVLAIAGGAAAQAHDGAASDAAIRPLTIDYVLPAPTADDEDRARWSIPEPLEGFGEREAPRLRFNGRKVKLRVPIG